MTNQFFPPPAGNPRIAGILAAPSYSRAKADGTVSAASAALTGNKAKADGTVSAASAALTGNRAKADGTVSAASAAPSGSTAPASNRIRAAVAGPLISCVLFLTSFCQKTPKSAPSGNMAKSNGTLSAAIAAPSRCTNMANGRGPAAIAAPTSGITPGSAGAAQAGGTAQAGGAGVGVMKAGVLSIAAVGDVMMSGSALQVIGEMGPDYPFDSTRALLLSADLAVANLEAPFGTQGKPFSKTFTFRVPPEFAPGLGNAGFDAVNLANNHILDFGRSCFITTLGILDSLGIAACGAGMNLDSAEAGAVVVRKGWKTAFLGYSLTYPDGFWASPKKAGTAFAVRERMTRRIAALRPDCDLVVVSFHWGKELHDHPEPYQRDFAHAAIDAGADLVLGHHPHVPQGFELYRGKPVAYSLGNFVFGSRSASCTEGILFTARFDTAGFVGAEAVPLNVDYRKVRYQPRLLRSLEKENTIRRLNRISSGLNGGRDILSPAGEMRKEWSTDLQ